MAWIREPSILNEELEKIYKKYYPNANDEKIKELIYEHHQKYDKKYYIDDEILKSEYVQKFGCKPPNGFEKDLTWRIPKMNPEAAKPSYTIGWIYYAIGMIGSLFFKEWLVGWGLCTFAFIWWVAEKKTRTERGNFIWTKNIDI